MKLTIMSCILLVWSVLGHASLSEGSFDYKVTFTTETGKVASLTVRDNDLFGILKYHPVNVVLAKEFASAPPEMWINKDNLLVLKIGDHEAMELGTVSPESTRKWGDTTETRSFSPSGEVSKLAYYETILDTKVTCSRKFLRTVVITKKSIETNLELSIPGDNYKILGLKETVETKNHYFHGCKRYLEM